MRIPTSVTSSLERMCLHHRIFGLRFPTVGVGARYQISENDNWLTGFWPGMLWLAYAATEDDELRDHAEALLPSFEERLEKRVHINHDLGFLFTLSARAQWQLTGDQEARMLALRAAQGLVQRHRTQGRYIQAWGPVGDRKEKRWSLSRHGPCERPTR
jgi:unsaturated chondroitin disaccharide hydrolase